MIQKKIDLQGLFVKLLQEYMGEKKLLCPWVTQQFPRNWTQNNISLELKKYIHILPKTLVEK